VRGEDYEIQELVILILAKKTRWQKIDHWTYPDLYECRKIIWLCNVQGTEIGGDAEKPKHWKLVEMPENQNMGTMTEYLF
jgi:hypothetical protein